MPSRKRGSGDFLNEPTSSVKKRKSEGFLNTQTSAVNQQRQGYFTNTQANPPTKKPKTDPNAPPEEKRLRRFRPAAPKSFHEVYERAMSQRFYVLKRERRGTSMCPEEVVEMTGSTGNVYEVRIAQQPRCNCPHAQEGNQCKHVLYVWTRSFYGVLRRMLIF